jgi:arsenate reductase
MQLLFICTHNRCRSILAEAIANHLGGGKIQAFSAGSAPAGVVHPLTLQYLIKAGIPTEGLHSKSLSTLTHLKPDLVITLCDEAAAEPCPVWLGASKRLHWGLADPSKTLADEGLIEQAFNDCIALLKARINGLLAAQPAQNSLGLLTD